MAQSNDDNIRTSLNIRYNPEFPNYACLYRYTYNILSGETIEEEELGYFELKTKEEYDGTK